jgi:hypothetical protein
MDFSHMIARLAREAKTPGVITVRELIAEPLKNRRISLLAGPIIRARQFSAFIGLIG